MPLASPTCESHRRLWQEGPHTPLNLPMHAAATQAQRQTPTWKRRYHQWEMLRGGWRETDLQDAVPGRAQRGLPVSGKEAEQNSLRIQTVQLHTLHFTNN